MAEVLRIDKLRERIDAIDAQLVHLLNVRVVCAVEIGQIKQGEGQDVYQPGRETSVLKGVRHLATELAGPLTPDAVSRLFEQIIDEARRAERQASQTRSEESQPAKESGE